MLVVRSIVDRIAGWTNRGGTEIAYSWTVRSNGAQMVRGTSTKGCEERGRPFTPKKEYGEKIA